MSDSQSYESSSVTASVLNSAITSSQTGTKEDFENNDKKVVEHFSDTAQKVWLVFAIINLLVVYKCHGKFPMVHLILALIGGPIYFVIIALYTQFLNKEKGLFCLSGSTNVVNDE
tara:strand:+ start:108 stop:452 length:345 start_codon:yes stop_codon:yes gene_type:complete